MPMNASNAPSRFSLLIAATLLVLTSMSATCENQDFSEIFTHAFNSENAESLMPIQVFNPYDARTAVEFRLTNTGTEPLNVTLYARAINTTDISDDDADIQDTTPQDTSTDSTSFDSEMLDTMVPEDTAQDTPDDVSDTGAAACITSDDCVGSSSGNICLPGNVCGCDTSDNCVRVDSGNLCLNAVCTTCVDDQECITDFGARTRCAFGRCEQLSICDVTTNEDNGENSDCLEASGSFCVEGFCRQCLTSDNCERSSSGNLCLNNTCTTCFSDQECVGDFGTDTLCAFGRCEQISKCIDDDGCLEASGSFCIEGFCRECRVPDDCARANGGNICLPNNACGCETSEDCLDSDFGNLCVSNFCVACAEDQECLADFGEGALCSSGLCEAVDTVAFENVCIPIRGALNQDTSPGVQNLDTLEPGESVAGRFGEDELVRGIGVELEVVLECPTLNEGGRADPNCQPTGQGLLEYTVLAAQRECTTNNDCADDETCDATLGRCIGIECGPDLSCPSNQECDRATCRCSSTGCLCDVHSDRPAPMPPWGWVMMVGLLVLVLVRRRGHGQPAKPWLVVLCLSVALWWAPHVAEARCPFFSGSHDRTFDRPGASLFGGIETRAFTGALSADSGTGLGLFFGQVLQWRYVAFQMTLGTSYFLTNQEPPPLQRGLQLYSVRVGPRFQCSIGSLRPYIDIEYERIGLISNALVRQTGPDTGFDGFGAAVGIQWLPLPYMMIALQTSYVHIPQLDSGLTSAGLNFGLVGSL